MAGNLFGKDTGSAAKGFCAKHRGLLKGTAVIATVAIAFLVVGKYGGVELKRKSNLGKRDIEEKIAENRKEHDDNPVQPLTVDQSLSKEVTVDISGAVLNPGVYTVDSESRINDVVELAGGLLENADVDAVNRAVKMEDGAKIYIPEKGKENPVAESAGTIQNNNGLININTADINALQNIPGVGPSTAEKIVEDRKKNGSFKSKEEIIRVSGIGDKTYENMADVITV